MQFFGWILHQGWLSTLPFSLYPCILATRKAPNLSGRQALLYLFSVPIIWEKHLTFPRMYLELEGVLENLKNLRCTLKCTCIVYLCPFILHSEAFCRPRSEKVLQPRWNYPMRIKKSFILVYSGALKVLFSKFSSTSIWWILEVWNEDSKNLSGDFCQSDAWIMPKSGIRKVKKSICPTRCAQFWEVANWHLP